MHLPPESDFLALNPISGLHSAGPTRRRLRVEPVDPRLSQPRSLPRSWSWRHEEPRTVFTRKHHGDTDAFPLQLPSLDIRARDAGDVCQCLDVYAQAEVPTCFHGPQAFGPRAVG